MPATHRIGLGLRTCLLAAWAAGVAPLAAHASSISITVKEEGADVVLSYTGAFDISGLTITNSSGSSYIGPSNAVFVNTGGASTVLFDRYTFRGFAPYGSGGLTTPTSGSGDPLALNSAVIAFASGYSGGSINGTLLFQNADFASLGIDGGSQTITRGNNTVNFTAIAPVPLPATGPLSLLALFGVALLRGNRRSASNLQA